MGFTKPSFAGFFLVFSTASKQTPPAQLPAQISADLRRHLYIPRHFHTEIEARADGFTLPSCQCSSGTHTLCALRISENLPSSALTSYHLISKAVFPPRNPSIYPYIGLTMAWSLFPNTGVPSLTPEDIHIFQQQETSLRRRGLNLRKAWNK